MDSIRNTATPHPPLPTNLIRTQREQPAPVWKQLATEINEAVTTDSMDSNQTLRLTRENQSFDSIKKLTDTGNAERLAKLYGEKIRFNHSTRSWFYWNGAIWKEDKSCFIIHLATQTVKQIYGEAVFAGSDKEREEIANHAIHSESRKSLYDMAKLAESYPTLSTTQETWDNKPFLLNCINGTYDLERDLFRASLKEDYLTKKCAVEYDPNAVAVSWLGFMRKVFNNDEELIGYVQRSLGYSLSGDTSEQCLFFAFGNGKNGKSVFFETIMRIMGDYAQKAPSDMLMVKNNGGGTHDIARLIGSRFVVCTELSEAGRLNEALVKDLTGSERTVARRLYQASFEFTPTNKFWFGGNYKPSISGGDEGIWRRMRLIPFAVTIAKSEQRSINELLDEFAAEAPGILNWMIEGWRQYKTQGLNTPQVVVAATVEYRDEMDALTAFVDECCVKEAGARVAAGNLSKAYRRWSVAQRRQPLGEKRFSERMRTKGFHDQAGAHNIRFWHEIRLQDESLVYVG